MDQFSTLVEVDEGNENEFWLKVKKLHPFGKVNPPAKHGDAGHDVYATKTITLEPQERYNMPLGVAIEFPWFLVCLVHDKSGIAKNTGLVNVGGVIDSGYRGEIHAQVVNSSNKTVIIQEGHKIAQLVFVPYFIASKIVEEQELSTTDRGDAGFGSTGVK